MEGNAASSELSEVPPSTAAKSPTPAPTPVKKPTRQKRRRDEDRVTLDDFPDLILPSSTPRGPLESPPKIRCVPKERMMNFINRTKSKKRTVSLSITPSPTPSPSNSPSLTRVQKSSFPPPSSQPRLVSEQPVPEIAQSSSSIVLVPQTPGRNAIDKSLQTSTHNNSPELFPEGNSNSYQQQISKSSNIANANTNNASATASVNGTPTNTSAAQSTSPVNNFKQKDNHNVENPKTDTKQKREHESEHRHGRDYDESLLEHLNSLNSKVPLLSEQYKLVDLLGQGTFSTVYKALDRNYDNDNKNDDKKDKGKDKEPSVIQATSKSKPKYVAVKKIHQTSSPNRILNELQIIRSLHSCRNCMRLITASRHEDQVFAVLTYEKHQDFRYFFRQKNLKLMRNYLRSIFKALADVHSLGYIHRDIKPANFLFNPSTGHGVLCDFGLAEKLDVFAWQSKCLHSIPCFAKKTHHHGVKMDRPYPIVYQIQLGYYQTKHNISELRQLHQRSKLDAEFYKYWDKSSSSTDKNVKSSTNSQKAIGYLRSDLEHRPNAKANKAGTRGFRAPEILLKCPDQTGAIDVWSVGVIFLTMLTERFPFFSSNDDADALMEMVGVFGKRRIEKSGIIHNRAIQISCSDSEITSDTIDKQVFKLNPSLFQKYFENLDDQDMSKVKLEDIYHQKGSGANLLKDALDLLSKCLNLDLTKRIPAKDALLHPFLTEHVDNPTYLSDH